MQNLIDDAKLQHNVEAIAILQNQEMLA